MTEYRGAVLIIGSLWWDTEKEARANWQKDRLDINSVKRVYAPIRYGKLSEIRNNTYTMVFSLSCYGNMIGTALLVPFQRPVTTSIELIIEAQKLWEAEGGISGRVAGTWGAVGLSVNPKSNFPKEMSNSWKGFYKKQERRPEFKAIGNEQPSLSKDGILMFQWIDDVPNKNTVEFDFILATATLPNVEHYPTSKEIAQACLSTGYTEYFERNHKNDIVTFQDDEILSLLYSKK